MQKACPKLKEKQNVATSNCSKNKSTGREEPENFEFYETKTERRRYWTCPEFVKETNDLIGISLNLIKTNVCAF